MVCSSSSVPAGLPRKASSSAVSRSGGGGEFREQSGFRLLRCEKEVGQLLVGVLILEVAAGVHFGQDGFRQDFDGDQFALQFSDRDFAESLAFQCGGRGGKSGGVPLILHVRLHPDQRHAVAVALTPSPVASTPSHAFGSSARKGTFA